MSSSLAERLSEARHSRFVGRALELKLFESVILPTRHSADTVDLPFQVLHVFGPGGVGKTTLLSEFTRICEKAQTPTVSIDARNVEPAPESFLSALRFVMNLNPNDSLPVLAAELEHKVLLIDTYETFAPLDDWLREVFLPQLPATTCRYATSAQRKVART